jgi:hypothetical protein
MYCSYIGEIEILDVWCATRDVGFFYVEFLVTYPVNFYCLRVVA